MVASNASDRANPTLQVATNKILALVGRLEPRDWIDAISCHTKLQRLEYLIWAACGKDEGYGPGLMLDDARASDTTRRNWICWIWALRLLAQLLPKPGERFSKRFNVLR